jgi:hypothetical protein
MILPLDIHGRIYALQDAQGDIIGTGTREVCEVLMYVITKASTRPNSSGNERAHVPKPECAGCDGNLTAQVSIKYLSGVHRKVWRLNRQGQGGSKGLPGLENLHRALSCLAATCLVSA